MPVALSLFLPFAEVKHLRRLSINHDINLDTIFISLCEEWKQTVIDHDILAFVLDGNHVISMYGHAQHISVPDN